MSTPLTPPLNQRYPFALDHLPHDVQQAHIFAFNAILDLQRANEINSAKLLALKPQGTTTVVSGGGGSSTIINGTNFPGLGGSRDLTGLTSYTTLNADNGILLLINDAPPVSITLDSGMPIPYFLFATNFGAGTATLTPTSGTINGSASFSLPQNYFSMVVFDGTNWHASSLLVLPQSAGPTSHQWLASYNAATGVFTLSQPAFTDISGNLATSQLPTAGISATITTAALTVGGTQGSMTFTNGLLTAQVQAT